MCIFTFSCQNQVLSHSTLSIICTHSKTTKRQLSWLPGVCTHMHLFRLEITRKIFPKITKDDIRRLCDVMCGEFEVYPFINCFYCYGLQGRWSQSQLSLGQKKGRLWTGYQFQTQVPLAVKLWC